MASLPLSAESGRPLALPWLWAAPAAAYVGLAFAPILIADIPALVDYPNHLARMSVLARAGTADANPFYDVAWAPYPNLAMDLLVPPLARLLGVEAATKLFYLLAQLLVVSGAMALALARGGAFAAAGLVAATLLYAIPFAWGFANFEFGLGLGLWAIAAWIGIGPRRPVLRFAVHCAAVMALALSHLFALGLYGVTLVVIEAWRARTERLGPIRLIQVLVALAAPAALLGLAALFLGGAVGGSANEWQLAHKLRWLFFLNGFSRDLSLVLTVLLLVLGWTLFRSAALKLAGAGPWLAAAFAILYLVTPFRLLDTAFVDVRVLVAAALILPAFVEADPKARPALRRAAAVACAVGLVNLAYVVHVQAAYRQEYGALVRALSALPKGARVLVAHAAEAEDPPDDLRDYPMHQVPTLAVHYAHGFVPTLFAYPGKQPVRPKDFVRALSVPQGGPIPMADLRAIAEGVPAPPAGSYAANWLQDFGYLCVVGPAGPDPMPGRLERLAGAGRFTLYRILPGLRP